jgi:hypothetical protein
MGADADTGLCVCRFGKDEHNVAELEGDEEGR